MYYYYICCNRDRLAWGNSCHVFLLKIVSLYLSVSAERQQHSLQHLNITLTSMNPNHSCRTYAVDKKKRSRIVFLLLKWFIDGHFLPILFCLLPNENKNKLSRRWLLFAFYILRPHNKQNTFTNMRIYSHTKHSVLFI